MRRSFHGLLWRLAVYAVVCLTGMALVVATMGELRFDSHNTYRAVFANASGLAAGNFVRAAGVEVGKVKSVKLQPDSTVLVEFGAADSVLLTEGSRAAVRYQDLIGGRFLALEEGTGGPKRIHPGDTIPLSQTEPALDLEALVGGFRPLFRALEPEQVNALTGQLIAAFQGQGTAISSILSQTAALTNTLADRDQLIGELITNLNTVLGSFASQSGQLATTVESLTALVDGLEAQKKDISDGLAYADAAAKSLADLLTEAREPVKKIVTETDRTTATVLADKEYFDDLLKTLPDAYRIINRLGLYGDFFSFYLCELVLKVNGKGGQPVYVKLAGQSSGRCEPR
ncbi:MCE family protein [Mycolicibacterium sp. XJ1819]